MKTTYLMALLVITSVVLIFGSSANALAEDGYCEVMTVEGSAAVLRNGVSAPIKEGDHLKTGDRIEVGQGSLVDLAYDNAWKNVTRIRENSEVKIGSLVPTHINMKQGDIFSRIKALPAGASFEVETPTAVAAVRGTEFRTLTEPDGRTEIQNFSELPTSQILVFGMDSAGKRLDSPVTLDIEKKTEIPKVGDAPLPPRLMTPEELNEGNKDNEGLRERSNLPGVPDDKKLGVGGGPGNGPGDAPGNDFTGGGKPGGNFMDHQLPAKDFAPSLPPIPEHIQDITDMAQHVGDRAANAIQRVQDNKLPPPPPTGNLPPPCQQGYDC